MDRFISMRPALRVFTPEASLNPAGCAAAAGYGAALRALRDGPAHDVSVTRTRFEASAQRFPQVPRVVLHAQRLREGATDDLVAITYK